MIDEQSCPKGDQQAAPSQLFILLYFSKSCSSFDFFLCLRQSIIFYLRPDLIVNLLIKLFLYGLNIHFFVIFISVLLKNSSFFQFDRIIN